MTSIIMRNKLKKALCSCGVILFWIVLWQIGASSANRSLLLAIPTPVSTAEALLRLLPQQSFLAAAGLSVLRILAGYGLAVLLGTVCAAAAHRFPFFRTLTAPLLSLIRSVPVAAFIILVFLWMSTDTIPIFISFLMIFPLVWANVEAGLGAVDRRLLEMAHVMGLPRGKTLTKILLPALSPSFFSALTAGLGFAWKSGVAAEVICRTSRSLGNLLWVSKNAIDYDEVFALTVVIVVLSVLLETLVRLVFGRKKA